MTDRTASPPVTELTIPIPEFVAMVAALIALNALAIDAMLPALDAIAAKLGVIRENDQQLIIIAYVFGFGAPQIVFGPLSDRFGRRPVLFAALVGYILAGIACMQAHTFELLLAMRFTQGVFASGCRVVAVSIVRDVFAGRGMARIMSLVMTVFMVVPILAPAMGQGVLYVAPWEWIFGLLSVAGLGLLVWTGLRLKETLPEARRKPLHLKAIGAAYKQIFTSRVTFGYMLASGVIFGALFAYIASSEQIFREIFDKKESFALWFGGIAVALSAANFLNSRLVERFGMRRLSHIALVGFILSSLALLMTTYIFGEHLWLFYPLFALTFAFFGLIGANFSALAMEPLGSIAGTASAAYGFATTTLSGAIGGLIGRAYNGTVAPVLIGYVILGLLSLIIVFITEKGRLFSSR